MTLEIITPEGIAFSGEVTLVTLPGTAGSFSILNHHAPIISSLKKGIIEYTSGNKKKEFEITGGFTEISYNKVVVCVETK